MKYFGKKLLLSGIILSVIGGGVGGTGLTAEAKATKAANVKTEVSKKKPTKKVVKKVDYKKVQEKYAVDLLEIKRESKNVRTKTADLEKELSGFVTYESAEMVKIKADVKKSALRINQSSIALDKKVAAASKNVKTVNTPIEKIAFDKEVAGLIKEYTKVQESFYKLNDTFGDYYHGVFKELAVSKAMFKNTYTESVGVNGVPTDFDDVMYNYETDQLLKSGRDYANKKLAEGYSQDRIAEWYLTEFEDLVSHRRDRAYVDLLKLKDDHLVKYTNPLYARQLDVVKNNMGDYNAYVDGLKKRIDGMIERDIKKVAI